MRKAHLDCELNPEMTKATDPEDGDQIAGPTPVRRSELNMVSPAHAAARRPPPIVDRESGRVRSPAP